MYLQLVSAVFMLVLRRISFTYRREMQEKPLSEEEQSLGAAEEKGKSVYNFTSI